MDGGKNVPKGGPPGLDSGKLRVTKSEVGMPSLPNRIVCVSWVTKRPPANQEMSVNRREKLNKKS